MPRQSHQKQHREAKRILGILLTWEDELAPKREEQPQPEIEDDGLLDCSELRPYWPDTHVQVVEPEHG